MKFQILKYLFTILFFFFTTKINCQSLEMNLTIIKKQESLSCPFVDFRITFLSDSTQKFLFDRNAFEPDLGISYPTGFKFNPNIDLTQILERLVISRVVIENERGEMKFITDMPETLCLKSEIFSLNLPEIIYLSKDSVFSLDFHSFNSNYLKRNVSDMKIRMHYLMKVDDEQMQQGLNSRVISSNWVNLSD